jgi:hypothetical protein
LCTLHLIPVLGILRNTGKIWGEFLGENWKGRKPSWKMKQDTSPPPLSIQRLLNALGKNISGKSDRGIKEQYFGENWKENILGKIQRGIRQGKLKGGISWGQCFLIMPHVS